MKIVIDSTRILSDWIKSDPKSKLLVRPDPIPKSKQKKQKS